VKSAVLFLVFNRPETTLRVFETIKAARPKKLYIAADGPRAERTGEQERCNQVRQIATSVDWSCEVKTLFRDRNYGCKLGVSSGIDWFFSQEEEGIILEDDILPMPSFFEYCDYLLQYYREDERIGLISGCNFIANRFKPKESYFFSRHNHIWGWATWRRAWMHYDVNMRDWPAWRDENGLKMISGSNRLFESYWQDTFENAYLSRIDTWDYQWTFTCWKHGMLSVLPMYNLINNIGFGPDATHTKVVLRNDFRPEPLDLVFPLVISKDVCRAEKADAIIDKYIFHLQWKIYFKQRLLKIVIIRKTLSLIKILLTNYIKK